MVAAAYGDKLVHMKEDIDRLVLVNGTGTAGLYLETERTHYIFTIYNCMGQLVESGVVSSSLIRLNVPISGVAMIGDDF